MRCCSSVLSKENLLSHVKVRQLFLCVEKLSDSLLPTILDEELLRHVYVVVFRICCSQKRRQRAELFSVHPPAKYAILKVSYMRRWYNV